MLYIVNQRPVLFLAFFMVVGISISYYLKVSVPIFVVLLCIGCFLFTLLFFKKHRRMIVPLYLIILALGGILFQIQFTTDFSNINETEIYSIEGYVSDRSGMTSTFHTYTLDHVLLTGEGDTSSHKFDKKILLYSREVLNYGDTVTFESQIKPPGTARNPGGMDERMYLASKGAGVSCFSEEVRSLSYSPGWYQYPLMLREKLTEKIDQIFSEQMAPLAKAMFLGVKTDITEETRDAFAKTGIAHILAVSGLHVAIVSYAFQWFLRRLHVRRNIRFSVNIAVLLFYALLTGFAPSIIRAVLMMLFLIIGRWMFKKRDTLTFLAAAMIITLCFNAPQLFTAGFLMSYGVLFGLLCLGPPLTRLFHRIKLNRVKLSSPLATSVGATVSVFPLSAYYFNNISLCAPLANLFAIPLAGIIVVFTGLGAFFALFSLPIGHALAFPAELGLQALTWLNGVLASVSFGFIQIYAFPVWIGVVVFALLFLCSDYVFIRSKIKAMITIVVAIILLCFGILGSASQGDRLKAVILDVGTGDSIHIAVDRKNYLIDNGGNLQYSQINNYANNNRLHFDGVIITNDRTKNLKDLAENDKISRLYVPANYISKEYDADLEMKYYALYDKIELSENAYLDVIADDRKHLSLVLYYKNNPICLFAQNNAADITYHESVPVVKLANGGTQSSIDRDSLKDWNPSSAVISVRQGDSKGLPDVQLLNILTELDIRTLITAQDGSITITADETGKISVTTQKK